jgi:hypothetical protein
LDKVESVVKVRQEQKREKYMEQTVLFLPAPYISSSLVKGWLVSLFAPSVLILTIGQGRIGCKSETK